VLRRRRDPDDRSMLPLGRMLRDINTAYVPSIWRIHDLLLQADRMGSAAGGPDTLCLDGDDQ
jgi:hypothetical protein